MRPNKDWKRIMATALYNHVLAYMPGMTKEDYNRQRIHTCTCQPT
jgi:hypothetical protein